MRGRGRGVSCCWWVSFGYVCISIWFFPWYGHASIGVLGKRYWKGNLDWLALGGNNSYEWSGKVG